MIRKTLDSTIRAHVTETITTQNTGGDALKVGQVSLIMKGVFALYFVMQWRQSWKTELTCETVDSWTLMRTLQRMARQTRTKTIFDLLPMQRVKADISELTWDDTASMGNRCLIFTWGGSLLEQSRVLLCDIFDYHRSYDHRKIRSWVLTVVLQDTDSIPCFACLRFLQAGFVGR